MKKVLVSVAILGLFAFAVKEKLDANKYLKMAEAQLEQSLVTPTDVSRFPRSTSPDGKLRAVPSNDWTSGFYSGNLWYMYQMKKYFRLQI